MSADLDDPFVDNPASTQDVPVVEQVDNDDDSISQFFSFHIRYWESNSASTWPHLLYNR